MTYIDPGCGTGQEGQGLSGRAIGGLVIAALVILFIVVNRTQTEVSFIFTTVTMSLWIALTIAAVGGLIAGIPDRPQEVQPQTRLS